MKDLLLDTDIISYFFRDVPTVSKTLRSRLEEGYTLNMSVINFYELSNGLYYRDAKKQLRRLRAFTEFCIILPLTEDIADLSAKHFAKLRKKGKTIQHTDALIAGTAIINDLKLITNNTKHYEGIDGLDIENWVN